MATALQAALQLAEQSGFLTLSYMGLTSVPEAVWKVKGLVRLDLSHNELEELPPGVGELIGLQELWLNDNPLVSLPTTLERCLSLRIVDVRDTELTYLPRELSSLAGLEYVDITGCSRMAPAVQASYVKGGTTGLLAYLAAQEARRDLMSALTTRLTVDVYRESADTALGKATIARLVTELAEEFQDNDQLRTVIRNAERLLPLELPAASPAIVRQRYDSLMRDNARKALAADIELAIRALYYNRFDPRKVEGMVNGIMAAIAHLEDVQFLVRHARTLFPPTPEEVSGPHLLADLQALRERLAADRADAIAALTRALGTLYMEREPADVSKLAHAVCALIARADDIRSMAADAADVFPPEYRAAKASRVVRVFRETQKEKGLA